MTKPRSVTIEIPFPPSVNQYWRHVVIGKRAMVYISKRGKQYRSEVIEAMFRRFSRTLKPIDCRLAVQVDLYPPDRRKRDLDNYLKASLDAMTHAKLWADDELIDRLLVQRREIVKGGKLVVTVTEIVEEIGGLFLDSEQSGELDKKVPI